VFDAGFVFTALFLCLGGVKGVGQIKHATTCGCVARKLVVWGQANSRRVEPGQRSGRDSRGVEAGIGMCFILTSELTRRIVTCSLRRGVGTLSVVGSCGGMSLLFQEGRC
jgi:hypothetical protein